MNTGAFAVDPCFAFVIDRAEMKDDALTFCGFGKGEGAPVPNRCHEILIVYAGKLAFGAEGDNDGGIKVLFLNQTSCSAGCAVIDLKLPGAVKVQPVFARKLRTRIFAAGSEHDYISFICI